jgi:transcriptional regulator with XRE-family HTH domain
MPSALAPYHEDPAFAASRCFDRNTGKPVPPGLLKTYRYALAQYHLHPEAKFANGNYLDRGVTTRRHVRAAIIEHIGKEANRWEEQLHLGLDPEAVIEYGASPQAQETLIAELRDSSRRFGQRRLARAADVSLGEVSALLTGKSAPHRATLARLISAVHEMEAEDRRAAENEREVLAEATRRCDIMGLHRLASLADIDHSYLAKVLKGRRKPGPNLLSKLRTAFVAADHDERVP